MELFLRKFGNSTGLTFPPGLLKDMGLQPGQAVTVNTTGTGSLVITPKRRYTRAELIAQCNRKAPEPADLALWGAAKPVGREVF